MSETTVPVADAIKAARAFAERFYNDKHHWAEARKVCAQLDALHGASMLVERELLVRADSLLSLIRHRYRCSPIPDDVLRDVEETYSALRTAYEVTR